MVPVRATYGESESAVHWNRLIPRVPVPTGKVKALYTVIGTFTYGTGTYGESESAVHWNRLIPRVPVPTGKVKALYTGIGTLTYGTGTCTGTGCIYVP
jgi:hypothetical protein